MKVRERGVRQEARQRLQAAREPAQPPLVRERGGRGPRSAPASSSGGSGASASIVAITPVEPQRVRLGGEAALGERSLEDSRTAPSSVGRRLRADAARAGNPVGRVAAERDEVRHLLWLDAVALAHLGRPDPRERACRPRCGCRIVRLLARRAGTCRGRRSRRAPSLPAPPRTRRRRRGSRPPRSPSRLRDGKAHRLEQLRREIELLQQVVVELAAALVARERVVAVGRDGRACPSATSTARGDSSSQSRTSRLPTPTSSPAGPPAGAADRLRQRVVGAVRERVAVDDQGAACVSCRASRSLRPQQAAGRSLFQTRHQAELRARRSRPSAARSRPAAILASREVVERDRRAVRDAQLARAGRAGRCRRSRPGRAARSPRARSAPRRCGPAPRTSSAIPSCRLVPSGNMTTTWPSRQSCVAVSIAAASRSPRRTGKAPAAVEELLERRPEELRLGHEAQVAPREERNSERPRVEVRVVVRSEHEPALGADAPRPRVRSRKTPAARASSAAATSI